MGQSLTLETLAFQSLRQQQLMLEPCEDALRLYMALAVRAGRPAAEIYSHVFRWKGILFALYSKLRLRPEVQAEHSRQQAAVEEARTAHIRCMESPSSKETDRLWTFEKLERCQRAMSDFLRRTHSRDRQELTSVAEFTSRLPPGAVFLDYAIYIDLGRPEGAAPDLRPHLKYLVFVLRAGNPEVTMVHLPTPLEILNGQIFRWRELLPVSAANRDHEPALRQVTSRIADGLWHPVATHCRDARLLWVCPTGLLWAFPFAALPGPNADYLIRQTPIAYAVAARQTLRTEVPPRFGADARTPYVLVNEVAYANKSDGIRRGSLVTAGLTRYVQEPDLVPLTGSSATKAEFLNAVRKSGQNVCFVGHGIWSPRVKAERVILFSPNEVPRAGQPEDLASDPFQFRIPLAEANLTAPPRPGNPAGWESWVSQDELVQAVPDGANRFEFWACSVLLGPIHPTEGMQSVPRTLLLGGYRTVVAAQWNVHECAALPTIPQQFHQAALGDGLGDAIALQQAQCAAIDSGEVNANPFHWAAWEVIGDPGKLDRPAPQPQPPTEVRPRGLAPVVGGLVSLVVAACVWVAVRRRRSSHVR